MKFPSRSKLLQSRLPMLLLPLAAFIAVWPLLRNGCSCGHDIIFHLLNWLEVAAHWRAGILYPHWAHWAAWGAGEPRFIFYPPLSWLLGGALGSVANFSPTLWQWVPIAYSFIVLTAAGFTAYALARTRAAQSPALLAAVFYVINPYMLFVVYERTAYAELLAAIWMPLLLLGLLAEEVSILQLAVPIALLWLSNAPAAVMGCYTFAFIAVLRLVLLWRSSKSLRLCALFAGKIFSSLLLGLSLAAFYVFPAAYERRWVQIENVIGGVMTPTQNFLFGHTDIPLHDVIQWTVSWVATILFVLTIAFLAAAWRRQQTPQQRNTLLLLAALTVAILFLLLPPSTPLWLHLPNLIYLQFPWRFLAVLSAVTLFAAALALQKLPARAHRFCLILAVALPLLAAPVGYAYFHQDCDDDAIANAELHGNGALLIEPTDEYTPRPADGDQLRPHAEHFWLTSKIDGPATPTPPGEVTESSSNIESFSYTANLPTTQILVLDLWDYPAWRVTVNGNLVRKLPGRDDGLMTIPLAAGPSTIAIVYTRTWDLNVGLILSLLAAAVAILLRTGRLSSKVSCPSPPTSP